MKSMCHTCVIEGVKYKRDVHQGGLGEYCHFLCEVNYRLYLVAVIDAGDVYYFPSGLGIIT